MEKFERYHRKLSYHLQSKHYGLVVVEIYIANDHIRLSTPSDMKPVFKTDDVDKKLAWMEEKLLRDGYVKNNDIQLDQHVNYFGALKEKDTDNDGISDYDEIHVHDTNPFDQDTDGDGVSDFDELMFYNTNPLDTDSKGILQKISHAKQRSTDSEMQTSSKDSEHAR